MKRPGVPIGPPDLLREAFDTEPGTRAGERKLSRVLRFYEDVLGRLRDGSATIEGAPAEAVESVVRALGYCLSDADLSAELIPERVLDAGWPVEVAEAMRSEIAAATLRGIVLGALGARVQIDPLRADVDLGWKTREERSRGGRAFTKTERFRQWQEWADAIGRQSTYGLSVIHVARAIKSRYKVPEAVETIRKHIRKTW